MSDVGVVLGATFAVLMGAASISSRRGLEQASFEVLLLVSLAVAAPVFFVVAMLTTGFTETPLRGAALAAVGAVAGSVVGRSLYFLGIEYVGPGKSLSISATSPLYVAFAAGAVLGEDVTPLVWAGTVAVAGGIVGLSRDVRSEASRSDRQAWVVLAPFVSAVFIAGAVLLRKLALDLGLAPLEAATINMTVGLGLVAPVVLGRHGRSVLATDRRAMGYFLVSSVLMAVAFVCYFFGLRATPASVFFPVVQTQPLFALGFSALLLDAEIITPRTVASVAVVVAGAAIVVAG